jgi:hypothetical protein
MKFRTEIHPAPFERPIDHRRIGFSVGSCFADTIAGRLARYKFPLTANPTGVLFNPFSIADMLEETENETAEALQRADYVLITFGTAWVYEENGRVVANCGKRPAHLFTRRRLSVEEIVTRFDGVMRGPLAGKQVVFTLSPVRHLKDGFEENSLSKATLRLAIDEIMRRHSADAQYFPAFEILTDDLRDYRFYGSDLAHPSAQAVDYVWEKFSSSALTTAAQKLLPVIEEIVRATEHRPFSFDSPDHQKFRGAMLKKARDISAAHPEIDLDAEIKFFH